MHTVIHCPRINSGSHHYQVFIGVGMFGVIGVLIIGLWWTNVTFGKYIIQEATTVTISNTTEFIPMAKSLVIAYPEISETAYCAITQCKIIRCTSIVSSDPATFASNFVTSIFQNQCPTTKRIGILIFKDCNFPDGKLKNSWQMSNIEIDKIRFENCELHEIDIGAFATTIFKNTNSLTMINTQIKILKRHVFRELANLRSLMIHDNLITEAEHDLLNPLAESLQTIELDRSITNPQVLINITNGRQLSQVQLLSLQGNNIPNLTQEIFTSFPNILSLYIDSSKIININVNTFKSIRSIQQIFMNNNLMETLPNGLFDTILLYNPNFKLSITDNPWHCDCQLKWIHNMIIKYPKMFITIPKCRTPKINTDKSFLNAEFCDEQSHNEITTQYFTSTVTIDSPTEIQNNTESNDKKFINITCENSKFLRLKNLSKVFLYLSNNYELSISSQNFSLHEYNNGTVSININNSEEIVTILWFNINTNKIGNINCLTNVRERILLKNLHRDTTYIICMVIKLQLIPLPINCLILETKASNNTRTWLSNDDKAIALSIYSITIILFTLLGSGICFYIVRKHPSILRGSSRVIMVRRGHVKALILPKGVSYSDIQRQRMDKKKSMTMKIERRNTNYITPIETRKSYLSNIYESIRYKINTLENSVANVPPPLPPHPHHGVYQQQNHHHHQLSSLSLRIDTQHNETFNDEPYQIEENTGIYSCN